MRPSVSVVMPVYNGAAYLVDSVASVLEQSVSEIELICVNDGSTDESLSILEAFARLDDRVHVLSQTNQGIVAALNKGCGAARSDLIARMDCDDISFPGRLSRQLSVMKEKPEIAVLGAAIMEIDSDGDPLRHSALPAEHNAILAGLLKRETGHFHPTTMFRREVFERVGGYRSKYQWVEDHDLWLRMAKHGHLANLEEVLLCYRQHASSVCWQRSQQQRLLMDQLIGEAQGRPFNPESRDSKPRRRASAGPGKWARAASRGGFGKTLIKNWMQLLRTDEPLSYKTRMIMETALRFPAAYIKRLMNARQSTAVPTFAKWHQRLRQDMAVVASKAA